MGALRPTYTHEAIKKLVEMGIFKYVISQNTDGLHRLSGVPASKISELHGNSFVHKCEKCKTRYDVTRSMRDMTKKELEAVPKKICDKCRINHRTGRKCEKKVSTNTITMVIDNVNLFFIYIYTCTIHF